MERKIKRADGCCRIAVINSHPIQYFAPLYSYLNRDERIKVTALYCSDFGLEGGTDPNFQQAFKWDIDLLSGYRSVFLNRRAAQRVHQGFWSLIVPQIWREIRSGRYDVVWLHGYNFAAYLIAFAAAKSKGIPVLFRGELHLNLRRSLLGRILHKVVLARAFKFVDAFLSIGSANRKYYLAMGVPERKIFDVPYTVDNERFISAASLDIVEREAVRRRFGLPADRPVVLYAAKFMRRKHPDDVILAAAVLRDRGCRFSVLMVGGGEMDRELRTLVQDLKLNNVFFGGFVNQTELPRAYAVSDVFVLPSEHEPWGLTVNEVMCAGLPVIVSDEVGCVPDLVRNGINGYQIKVGDVAALVNALDCMLKDPELRVRMGRQSLAMIGQWSYEQCRIGLFKALHSVAPHLVHQEQEVKT